MQGLGFWAAWPKYLPCLWLGHENFLAKILERLIPAPHLGRGVHGWKDPTRGVGVGLWVGLWDRVLKWP